MIMGDERAPFEIPLVYAGLEDLPVVFANHFVLQRAGGTYVLIVGQLTPPLLLGDEDEQREQIRQIASVPIKPVGRYALSEPALRELVDLLQRNLPPINAASSPAVDGDSE